MEEQQQTPLAESIEAPQGTPAHTDGSIDFSGVKALANTDFTPEPWYASLGNSLLETLIKFGLFLFSVIIDVVKTLWVIVRGLFVGIYMVGRGVYRFFRNVGRMCGEGDRWVKMSTFCSGLGNLHGGQIGDGIVFLGAEILFILYMALFGGHAIFDLIFLGEDSRQNLPEAISGLNEYGELPNNSSVRFLISGVLTIIVIALYVFVWYSAMKSAHDNYIIRNNFRFLQAHQDQINVVRNAADYPEFFELVNTGKGEIRKYKSGRQIYRIAREAYGFPELSARYLSYVPFNRMEEREPNFFEAIGPNISKAFYKHYDKARAKIRAGRYASLFGKLLEWDYVEPEPKYGVKVVENQVLGDFNAFRHTYDKYNDYFSVTRDSESLLKVLRDPQLLEDAIYAVDPVSVKNGITPVKERVRVARGPAEKRVMAHCSCPASTAKEAVKGYFNVIAEGSKPLQRLPELAAAMRLELTNREKALEALGEHPDPRALKANAKMAPIDLELCRLYEDPKTLEDAIFARDPASVAANVVLPLDTRPVDPKSAGSRVVGAFECSYEDAVTASTYYLRAVKEEKKTGVNPKEKVKAICQELQQKLDDFVRINSTELKAGVHETGRLYLDFDYLMPLYGQGKKVFIETLESKNGLSKFDARSIYRDMAYAQKVYGDSEEQMREYLSRRGERHQDLVQVYEEYPFHGQPMHFKKKMKQYVDEKFAVTVLTLPVLGALITSVIPLLISIIVAFTRYTGANAIYGNFDWSTRAWETMFGGGTGGNLVGQTFLYILGWTLIWAVLATFTNYILGIVLALLINKKSIKFKAVFRTFFVISIAIPQFVTLLAMSKILGPGGPINTFFYVQEKTAHAAEIAEGTYQMVTRLDTWWTNDPANQGLAAKICLVLVNVWIGIPYTMLSTTGILLNIPEDLYESANIDGASPWTQFWKITMPYILFVTGPSLLTTFIGNINNFNVIFFLTGGGPTPDRLGVLDTNAGYTDLLITYLFKITINSDSHLYSLGSVIGILVFAICAFFSLIMYSRMGSTQNEEAFQ